MLFGNDRTSLRRFYVEAWRKLCAGEPLEPLQQQVAEVVRQHPEYHAMLEGDDALLERDFTPEQGQSNPFLHMGMHLAIREQLATQRPAGVVECYRALLGKFGDVHTVEHHMMECLGEMLWQAQRDATMPQEQVYLDCLRRLK